MTDNEKQAALLQRILSSLKPISQGSAVYECAVKLTVPEEMDLEQLKKEMGVFT